MNNVSLNVENSLQSLASQLVSLNYESNDLFKYYFASGASDAIAALAAAGTPATTGGLNKTQYLNGITLVTQFKNFFSNVAVVQGDYLSYAENLILGSSPASAAVSADVEAIGVRLKSVGGTCIAMYKQAKQILDLWTVSGLSACNGALSSTQIMPGCSTSKSKFDSGISLLTQFVNMLENAAVTTGTWGSTSAQWTQNA